MQRVGNDPVECRMNAIVFFSDAVPFCVLYWFFCSLFRELMEWEAAMIMSMSMPSAAPTVSPTAPPTPFNSISAPTLSTTAPPTYYEERYPDLQEQRDGSSAVLATGQNNSSTVTSPGAIAGFVILAAAAVAAAAFFVYRDSSRPMGSVRVPSLDGEASMTAMSDGGSRSSY
jgi:hypothetical protein